MSLDPNAEKNAHLSDNAKAAIERYYASRADLVRAPEWVRTDCALLRSEAKYRGVDVTTPLAAIHLAEDLARTSDDPALGRLYRDFAVWIRKHPEEWKKGLSVGFYSNLKPGYAPSSGD